MKIKEIKTYTFDELSLDAQQHALEKYRDINVDLDDWAEFVLEESRLHLETLGYTDVEIKYSGFWSQGDGASFTASIDLDAWLKAHKLAGKYPTFRRLANSGMYIGNVIRNSHHYYHENTVHAVLDCADHPAYLDEDVEVKANQQLDAIEKLIDEEVKDESRKIYKALETEYYFQTSDENVKNTLIDNEYDFTENGEIF